jgi:tripartite-type tricarboxylate transporter receptor subunit TctC
MEMFLRSRVLGTLVIIALGIVLSRTVAAQSDVDFKGKTVKIIVGTSTGGGVDLYARLIALFLGKHLPG